MVNRPGPENSRNEEIIRALQRPPETIDVRGARLHPAYRPGLPRTGDLFPGSLALL